MIEIDDKLISDHVVSRQFVCDLNKCKGGCCVDGDAGAPITEEEAQLIEKYYPAVKHLLMDKAVSQIEAEGTHTTDDEFDLVTPTIEGGICVYGYYDELGHVKCAFEKEYNEGRISFKKPISCHLYPIRTQRYKTFEAVNYEPRETLCKPACKLGKQLKVPVYRFLKEPLIRKYGEEFYNTLDQIAKEFYGVQ